MKKILLYIVSAAVVLSAIVSCVKELENEGIFDCTEYTGVVVEKSTNTPIAGVMVQVTDGTHIHAQGETNTQGRFDIEGVDFEEVDEDYYLWLDGTSLQLPSKQEELRGLGQQIYDYKTLILYDKTNADILPKVSTGNVTDVTASSANVGGSASSEEKYPITGRGICFATHQVPTIDDAKVAAGSGSGSFSCELKNLTENTTYYVRAYAINSIGITYGAQKMFTTKDGKAKVTLNAPSSVTASSASFSGTVSDDGGAEVTTRGFCWATTQNPTISDNKSTNGSDTGSFTHTVSNLQVGTTYHARAYATNACGTVYSEDRTFTTADGKPTVTTATVSDITAISAKCGGNVTANGGYNVTARGVCWNTSGNPTISDSKTTNGTGNGSFTSNMTGLTAGVTYHVRAYATNSNGTSYGTEKTFTTLGGAILLTTTNVTSITATSAVSGGNITSDGGSAVTERGLCWSTSPYPVATGSHIALGSGSGTFTGTMTGLSTGTTYYVRAYAKNSVGTSYGDQKTFATTNGTPTVTTTDVSEITAVTAKCGGNVTANGGYNVTARGVCWNTSGNPTISDSKTTNGTGNGSFTSNMTGLTAGVTYHVRAYATNSNGTSYGTEKTFTTLGGAILLTTTNVTSITATSAVSGGNITSDGGSAVTERGLCWSTSPYPVATGSHIALGSGSGTFTGTMTGLSTGTTYYVRAYAKNSVGTSYGDQKTFATTSGMPTVTTATSTSNVTATSFTCGGNVTNDGGFSVTAKGLCWSTNQLPTIADNHNTLGSGLGSFTGSCNGLTRSTTYYVRAYATNSKGTSYGEQRTVTTASGLPAVTTTAVSMSGSSVVSGGNVTSDGGSPVTARGICYGPYPNPDLSSAYTHTSNGTGTGYFTSVIGSSLTGTTYVRAYATNANGTSYGNQVTANMEYLALPTFEYNGHTYRVAPDPHTFASEYISWESANAYCENLTLYEYSDWRMPTIEELETMYQNRNVIGGFVNSPSYYSYYHSSTVSGSYHYLLNWDTGARNSYSYLNIYGYDGSWRAHVRPIRVEN